MFPKMYLEPGLSHVTSTVGTSLTYTSQVQLKPMPTPFLIEFSPHQNWLLHLFALPRKSFHLIPALRANTHIYHVPWCFCVLHTIEYCCFETHASCSTTLETCKVGLTSSMFYGASNSPLVGNVNPIRKSFRRARLTHPGISQWPIIEQHSKLTQLSL